MRVRRQVQARDAAGLERCSGMPRHGSDAQCIGDNHFSVKHGRGVERAIGAQQPLKAFLCAFQLGGEQDVGLYLVELDLEQLPCWRR